MKGIMSAQHINPKKDYCIQCYENLMNSDASALLKTEESAGLASTKCTSCNGTQLCSTWGAMSALLRPKECNQNNPSQKVKDYSNSNPTPKLDVDSEEYKEHMRKYDEARNKNFPKTKSTASSSKISQEIEDARWEMFCLDHGLKMDEMVEQNKIILGDRNTNSVRRFQDISANQTVNAAF